MLTLVASTLLTVIPFTRAVDGLSKVDQAAGWKLYTGSNARNQWRGYKQDTFPAKGWTLTDGVLSIAKGGGGGDLITKDQFTDVEVTFEFKLGEKANSGIMWRTTEKHETTWQTGPEYQLLEDTTAGVKPTEPHACAAMYDLYPCYEGKTLNPAGQWNSGRIYLRNGLVQHWLNGKKVVEATIFDDAGKPTKEWLDKIAGSKFKDYQGFGVQPKGSVAIQDHGDTELSLRNVIIRDPSAPMPKETQLFNGKNLDGWVAIVPDAAKNNIKPEDVWSVKDGILICKGLPVGYIRTKNDYKNYVLRVEWRFSPETKKAGNSGVLLRMVGEDKVWPKSIEAQLESGNAGDFWNIDDVKMTTEKSRLSGRNTKHTHGAERPIGEWNEYEIIVNKGEVILKVNGEELNRAWEAEEVAGKICLQSEGAEIHFRNIRLTPLE